MTPRACSVAFFTSARPCRSMALRVEVDPAHLEAFCQRNHVVELSFFGSVLRSDFDRDSDVDLLVRFKPTAHVTLLDIARMEREFSDLVDGRPVDIRTPEDLSPHFRDQVLRSAQVAHAG